MEKEDTTKKIYDALSGLLEGSPITAKVYNTETQHGRYHFRRAEHGTSLAFVLWDMEQWFRSKIKYAPDETPAEYLKGLEEARQKLWDFVDKYEVTFALTEPDD